MNIFSFLVTTVLAAETITPFGVLPNLDTDLTKPTTSFGVLAVTPTPIPTTPPQVLGTTTFIGPLPISKTPTQKPLAKKTQKTSVTIALLGDSMMDTLGPDAPTLKTALKNIYPNTTFTIKNFGVGGTNLTYGIKRITEGYTYLGKSYPSVASTSPDVVILESFGYNQTGNDEAALNAHWLLLAKAIDTIKATMPHTRIVIAATIAPNATTFGDGASGLSFSTSDKWERVLTIKKYLDNAVRFAESEHLPLADAYHPSLLTNGNGNLVYINGGDHIHYSDKGRVLMAQKIATAIAANRLLE